MGNAVEVDLVEILEILEVITLFVMVVEAPGDDSALTDVSVVGESEPVSRSSGRKQRTMLATRRIR